MTARIRVVLVDDHAIVRLGLGTLLAGDARMEVVGEASDGHEALAACERLQPDVVVMDLMMAGMDGVEATRRIAREHPQTKVLVLTMHEEEDYLIPLLEAGAAGYIVKSAASHDLAEAILAVMAGRTYVRPAAAEVLASGWTRRASQDAARTAYEGLSERERAVLKLLAEGYSTSQIGAQLFISAKTADTYRRRINEKMGFKERADYVRVALQLGLLSPG